MPFIETKATRKIGEAEATALREKLGRAIEIIPGKTDKWLMLSFQGETPMAFSGTAGDAAMVDVSILGHADDAVYAALTSEICNTVSEVLSISKDRIYVKYSEFERWGWNGINF